jgi:hypothetical protein
MVFDGLIRRSFSRAFVFVRAPMHLRMIAVGFVDARRISSFLAVRGRVIDYPLAKVHWRRLGLVSLVNRQSVSCAIQSMHDSHGWGMGT